MTLLRSQTLFTVPWKLLKTRVQKLFVSGSFYLFWELFSARASLVDLSLTRLELESFHGFRSPGLVNGSEFR